MTVIGNKYVIFISFLIHFQTNLRLFRVSEEIIFVYNDFEITYI